MSRPSFQPKQEQRKLVKSLSALGLPQEQICALVGMRSPKTLRKHFREALNEGAAEAEAAVMRTAYAMATSGKCLSMTLFWSKCQRLRSEDQERQEEAQERAAALERSRRLSVLYRVPKERKNAA
jgi:DNA-binding transcriptional MerR regulator